jgi:polysaccharide pyruvyl transferase CsaB
VLTVTALGYYGFNNLGDDLLLASLAQALAQALPVNLQILTQNPGLTGQQYPQSQCFHRMRPWSLVKALAGSQWLILGGGGLFQDSSSLKNVVYYAGVIVLARLLGNRVLWWAQGIGPLKHPVSQGLTSLALRLSHTLTVRDDQSIGWVRQLAPHKAVNLVADPVWLLNPSPPDSTAEAIGISLRDWPSLTPLAIQQLALVVHQSFAPHHIFMLLPFQPQQDDKPLKQFKAALPADRRIVWCDTPQQAFGSLTGLVGMRFHAVVLAVLHHVPVFAVAYDPKVSQLCQQLQVPCCQVEALDGLVSTSPALALPDAMQAVQKNAAANVATLSQVLSSA